jgi:hypothetical protein
VSTTESDCHYVVPDISDEELVFTETPIYGGSHFGIRPFNAKKALEHPVLTTDDVVFSSLPLESEELPEKEGEQEDLKKAMEKAGQLTANVTNDHVTMTTATVNQTPLPATHHILGMFVAFTTFGAAIGFLAARAGRASRSAKYTPLN